MYGRFCQQHHIDWGSNQAGHTQIQDRNRHTAHFDHDKYDKAQDNF
jgi:hypothetical protein